MIRYSVQLRDIILTKIYGFFFFLPKIWVKTLVKT